jgi:multidrug resistance efflux pump
VVKLLKRDVWQLRDDLDFRWVKDRSDSEGYWVVKDPLARDWYCVTDIEKQLLGLADGCRSVPELCRAAVESIAPLESSVNAMISFYAQARRKGLLILVGKSGPIDEAATRESSVESLALIGRGLGRLLAYRFPGFNPNAFPRLPDWVGGLATSRFAITALSAIALIALVTVVARFDVFTAELSFAFSNSNPQWWILVLVTIAIAKTIHELAHVAACRLVGAECREIGVMLLFGAPCLYCDVSDLWMVPERKQRIFVSAAGMLAEITLAAMATIVWAVTHQSMIHDLALVVMVVCSVSTVLVNANPLIRYDGYFMLADWLGVPNLSQRAAATLRRTARRVVWGDAEHSTAAPAAVGRRLPGGVIEVYAIASAAYRIFVIGIILLLLYHATDRFGLGWLGLSLGIMFIGSMIMRWAKQVWASPTAGLSSVDGETVSDQKVSAWWKHPRAILASMILCVVFAIVMLIPFRRPIAVPVLIVATDQRDVHASESGRLIRWTESGRFVQTGDILYQLDNAEAEDQLRRADAEVAEAKAIAEAWEIRKGAVSGNSTAIAISRKRVEAAEKNRRQAQERFNRLTILAPAAGQFSQRVPISGVDLDRELRLGQKIAAATQLGWIGHPEHRSGFAIATQGQIDLIKKGQSVRLRHGSLSGGSIIGDVQQVDAAAWNSVPAEFQLSGNQLDAAGPFYRIQIKFSDLVPIKLPLRSVAIAEITGQPRSVWQRLRRLVSSEFRGL